jgi:hypothetical protein
MGIVFLPVKSSAQRPKQRRHRFRCDDFHLGFSLAAEQLMPPSAAEIAM